MEVHIYPGAAQTRKAQEMSILERETNRRAVAAVFALTPGDPKCQPGFISFVCSRLLNSGSQGSKIYRLCPIDPVIPSREA